MTRISKKTVEQLEDDLKKLQHKIALAKIKQSKTRFSTELRKRLKAIMDNHNVSLTDSEINVIVNPCEICENLYFNKANREA